MVYFIACIVLFAAFCGKKSKVIYVGTLAFTWIMLGWSSGNADSSIYLSRYESYESASEYTEILYTSIMKLCNAAGLEYQQFHIIAMLIYVVVLGYLIWKNSCTPSFVLALYLIFPACMEAVQIRYTLASAFVLMGINFLLNDEGVKAEIKYILCIMVASLLHISTVVFLLFVVIKRFDMKKTIVYTGIISLLIAFSNIAISVNVLGMLPGMSEKISRVLSSAAIRYTDITVLKTIFRCGIYFGTFLGLQKLMINNSLRYNTEDELDTVYLYEQNITKLNIVSLLILPLLSYSVDFYRIQQTLTVYNYCALSYYIVLLPIEAKYRTSILITTNQRIYHVLGCAFMAFINLYYLVLNSNNILTVFKPFFESNLFFRGGGNGTKDRKRKTKHKIKQKYQIEQILYGG